MDELRVGAYRCADCEHCAWTLYAEETDGILAMDAGWCELGRCLVPTPHEPTETARECLGG